jgi:TolB-like protein
MRVHFSDLTFDTEARELRRRGERLHLAPKAFLVLKALIEERGTAVSKERLLEIVWPKAPVAESTLAHLITDIRSAIGDDPRDPKMIRTVFAHGYSFAADATVDDVPRGSLRAIAVLPFANVGSAEWDYVSDGIAEALLHALVKLPALRVVPLSTSFRYRGPGVDVRAAARDLRVDAIVTGRVNAREDSLTVSAELIDAKADAQMWGARFHGRAADLLHVQKQIETELTARIAERTDLPVSGPVAPASHHPQAYDHFLRGQHQLNRRDVEGLRRSIQAFRTATEIEPSFAPAHAALAEAYVTLGTRDLYPPEDIFPLAREAATRAIELDPSIAAAHTALAATDELFEWRWDRAEASHRTAVALEAHATAAQWFALHYARRGIHDEAQQWIHRAIALEPLSPSIITNAALVAYFAHDYVSAVQRCETALELAPHFEPAIVVKGVANIQIDPRRAVEDLDAAARLWGRHPFAIAHLASAHAAMGDRETARQIRDEIVASAASGYVSSTLLALAEIAAGDLSKGLDALEVAADQRSPWLSYVLSEPRLDPLRDEPRFLALVEKIGFGRT